MSSTMKTKRLTKELNEMIKHPSEGITVVDASNLECWTLSIKTPDNCVYKGESFSLKFVFSNSYPMESPAVTFVPPRVPRHEHCYSNGHICLSILYGDGWSPVLTVSQLCMSITSMLASATSLKTPPDDAHYVATCSNDPKKTRWSFHDDTV